MTLPSASKRQRGALSADLIVAMFILIVAVLPMAYAFTQEARLLRGYYLRAVAMEIVDGEMEILAAGEWRAYQEGTQPYTMKAAAAKNLPAGDFVFTKAGKRLRLEWHSHERQKIGAVVREVTVK